MPTKTLALAAVAALLLLAPPPSPADLLEAYGGGPAAAEIGDRIPLVFIHGYGVPNWVTWLEMRFHLKRSLRAEAGLEARVAPYFYSYDADVPYPQIGARLAATLRRSFPGAASRRFLVVTSSAGSLAARYAFAEPDLRESLGALISIVGPHHGALGASLLFANDHLRAEFGEQHWSAIADTRLEQGYFERPEVVYSLGFDNLGPPDAHGAVGDLIPPEKLARWGIPVNQELRALNLQGLHMDRIHVHQGSNRSFPTAWRPVEKTLFGTLRERQRAVVEAVSGVADSDPIVPLYSGTFAHSPYGRPASVTVYDDLSHHKTVLSGELCRNVMQQVVELSRTLDRGGTVVDQPSLARLPEGAATGTSLFGFETAAP